MDQDAEIRRLQAELEEERAKSNQLSQEVKRLVRTESDLYRAQKNLDAQLATYRKLVTLGQGISALNDLADVCRFIAEACVNDLEYERAATFLETESGFVLNAHDGYYEDEDVEAIEAMTLSADDPVVAALFAGREFVRAGGPGGPEPGPAADGLRTALLLAEMLVFPLANDRGNLRAILVLGNSETQAEFMTRVDGSEEKLLFVRNVVALGAAAFTGAGLYRDLEHERNSLDQRVQTRTQELSERTRDLEQKSRELEETNKALTDSISYASLLQSALLPERGKFAEIAEHFEIWWPRDVVGGDVYVVRPTAEGMLLGVMDCTGHGVPGAFMTVAASAAFDHAVAVCGGHSPGAILAEVNRYMRKRLNRSSEIGVDDGLEMGLVCWRPRARELVFAGGGLDLAVVDPAEARPPEAGETDPPGVTRIRGEKTGLGHRSSHPDHVFTDRPLQVTPGRAFYIASDGMLEQVGGERKLCFGWRRFRSVLAATAAHPLAEQREHLVAALQDWQGDCAQRDDITLIGVRPVAAPADTRDGGRNRGTGLGGVAQPDAADATNAAAAKP